MLYTVVYIHRSGSTSAARIMSEKLNAEYLGEVMYEYRHEQDTEKYSVRAKEIISISQNKDILIKLHVHDLLRIYDYSKDLLKDVFKKSSKLYYPIRLDYKSQIISQIIADKTKQWDRNREASKVMVLEEEKIPRYTEELNRLLSIQGEWHKQYPGELVVLENRVSNPYPKYDIKFIGLKSFLKKNSNDDYSYLFPKMNIMETFNNGNQDYKII